MAWGISTDKPTYGQLPGHQYQPRGWGGMTVWPFRNMKFNTSGARQIAWKHHWHQQDLVSERVNWRWRMMEWFGIIWTLETRRILQRDGTSWHILTHLDTSWDILTHLGVLHPTNSTSHAVLGAHICNQGVQHVTASSEDLVDLEFLMQQSKHCDLYLWGVQKINAIRHHQTKTTKMKTSRTTVDGRNPAPVDRLIGGLSHSSYGFNVVQPSGWWCPSSRCHNDGTGSAETSQKNGGAIAMRKTRKLTIVGFIDKYHDEYRN